VGYGVTPEPSPPRTDRHAIAAQEGARVPQPPKGDPACHHGLDVRETAAALAGAVDDPVLKALLRARPFVAMIILAHQGDHVEITPTGVSITYGRRGEEGSIHIAPDTLATLPDTRHPDVDAPPGNE
jgi:hypothetical protein